MQSKKAKEGEFIRVTAAVILSQGRVLIAQRKSGDRMAGCWEFPGGKIEDGESPEACLRRELKEELGINTVIGEYLGTSEYRYPHVAIKLLAYRAVYSGGALTVNDHAGIRWVPIGQLHDFDFTPADKPFVTALLDGTLIEPENL